MGIFEPALFYVGAVAFLGFCCYLLLIGKAERIEIEEG